MTESSRAIVRRWLFTAVVDLGEQAYRRQVHARITHLFGDEFSAEDMRPRVGRRGEAAWQNNVDSLYDQLKHRGEMLPSTRGGPWRLSPLSIAEAQRYRAGLRDDTEAELLADFKPKDSGEYIARLQGQVLTKRRDHEETLRTFGIAAAARGWKPATNVHPRDMELTRVGEVCLVEVKQVYRGNATKAVREATAQLLEYRYFWYRNDTRQPHLLAVFSEPIGDEHARYLESLHIASIWKITDEGWGSSALATSLGFDPGRQVPS
ncbi:hypothetical protein F6W69_13415 [Microbacterium oxydans]|uniref:hypothetical protein n=1 Tax=Microbacterium TaxID=33882 RepID=UPI0007F3EAA0|nr:MULTISPECIES: hypothetical protein [Microbacterium]KAB1891533.1 hypothetical protein F6W69_13415 [Microbacterium oxydans]OAN43153.1 hypothetical protein A4X16_08970 [Microbacterium sp. H83]GED38544.1 hypothetical protein MOX01_16860 [Microbacterium oxydans]